ncbi:MAG TPA: helix-turn-helix domain-containing protein [Thermoleophilaceae bacterium]|nr:helix-turn-helix domain-containing protein [Thermoleophilaceae bacterium]
MSGVMEAGMDGGKGPELKRGEASPEGRRETRWSAQRKEEVVLRLLRGESLDRLARETGQPAGRIAAWREEFLAAGREGLKARPRPAEERELAEAQRKIGELSMDLDIAKALLEETEHRPRRPRR